MVQKQVKILLVESNQEDAEMLSQMFAEAPLGNFKVVCAENLTSAKKKLSKEKFNAILLDLSLPDDGGELKLLQSLHEEFSEHPVIVLTGANDEDLANTAVKAGAQDFLVKGELTPNALRSRLRYAIERQETRKTLLELTFTDELTGLYNRRGFLALAEQQLKLARRTKCELLLIFVDLDGLKRINDQFGHSVGDQAIKKTASVLRKTFRESDILGRAGGDEFLILAIEASENNIEVIKTRFQKLLNEVNSLPNQKFQLSFSLGVSHFYPAGNQSIQDLIDQADHAMYEEKQKKQRV